MFRIRRNGKTVDKTPVYRIAKQSMRKREKAEPDAKWTVTDPKGRIVLS